MSVISNNSNTMSKHAILVDHMLDCSVVDITRQDKMFQLQKLCAI